MKFHQFYFVILLFLIACESGVEKHLKRLSKKSLYDNDYKGWNLFQVADDYAISKIDNDTLKTMRYTLNENGIPIINFYEEVFPCASDTCYLNMHDLDTLFFYSMKNGIRNFKVGEYAYRYTYLKLLGDEVKYYYLYEDSLKGVRGNNLPKLPNLNDREKTLYNDKVK